MKKAVVLHVDILGFKNIVKEAETNPEIFEKLKEALEQGVGTTRQFQGGAQKPPMNITYKLFSDNLYVSFNYEENDTQSFSDAILMCIAFTRSYSAVMLDNNFYIRGGISYGSDYSDDTTIFSMALVKAYELESQKAIYPRVVIDPEIIDFTKGGSFETPGPILLTVINNSILKDENGLYFVNPTGLSDELNVEAEGFKGKALNQEFIKRYLKNISLILQSLPSDTAEKGKIAEKYEWLQVLLLWLLSDRTENNSTKWTFNSLRFSK